jgi:hypothetical protein
MRWVAISGWPDYDISDEGKIRRNKPEARCHHISGLIFSRLKTGDPVKVNVQPNGYHRVRLCGANGHKYFSVHRLVCETFHGKAPSVRHHAAHENGDRTDNRADNLAWKLPTENSADKIRHGTHGIGERNPSAKLSEQDVVSIIELVRIGRSKTSISKQFGVTRGAIYLIASGRKWGHLSGIPRHSTRISPARGTPQFETHDGRLR